MNQNNIEPNDVWVILLNVLLLGGLSMGIVFYMSFESLGKSILNIFKPLNILLLILLQIILFRLRYVLNKSLDNRVKLLENEILSERISPLITFEYSEKEWEDISKKDLASTTKFFKILFLLGLVFTTIFTIQSLHSDEDIYILSIIPLNIVFFVGIIYNITLKKHRNEYHNKNQRQIRIFRNAVLKNNKIDFTFNINGKLLISKKIKSIQNKKTIDLVTEEFDNHPESGTLYIKDRISILIPENKMGKIKLISDVINSNFWVYESKS